MIKALVMFSALLVTVQVNAALITIGGENYKIQEVTGVFSELNADGLLGGQPWWGNRSLARQFAANVGYERSVQRNNFGYPIGALFAHSYYGSGSTVNAVAMTRLGSSLDDRYWTNMGSRTWAYVDAVAEIPSPSTAWLFFSAILSLVWFKLKS
ncbi:MAG: hypothetical protein WEB57_00665 [Pseudohongiellaceae bacterium]